LDLKAQVVYNRHLFKHSRSRWSAVQRRKVSCKLSGRYQVWVVENIL